MLSLESQLVFRIRNIYAIIEIISPGQRLIQPSPGKLDGIGSIFNRGQDQMQRINPNAITVEIDNSGDAQQQQQIGYIQQADGQLMMVNLAQQISPVKQHHQGKLININDSALVQQQARERKLRTFNL